MVYKWRPHSSRVGCWLLRRVSFVRLPQVYLHSGCGAAATDCVGFVAGAPPCYPVPVPSVQVPCAFRSGFSEVCDCVSECACVCQGVYNRCV